MSIFESLENLSVSEACFEDIIKLVEEYVTTSGPEFEPAKYKNKWSVYSKSSCTYEPVKGGRRGAEKRCKELNAICTDKPRIDLSYESLEDIIGIIKEMLNEGKEPFETTLDYKTRLQKHFGPILNDKMAAARSKAKHYEKKSKGLVKQEKGAKAAVKDAEEKEKAAYNNRIDKLDDWGNTSGIRDAVLSKYGNESPLYKDMLSKVDKAMSTYYNAKKKSDKATEKTGRAREAQQKITNDMYSAQNSADNARGEQDIIQNKIRRTGTDYYRHEK